ncbi:MAG: MG2 domain-containing protein [Paludisphaera borealis]|uniref:MG2 domain-containing protein n=1 Tax=Paludisphaera borealis TaxID=1387353 RepID=UPI00284DBD3A|nr:MG2 domain-containing protein [Paludisphaera borealis]MDR3619857.1 MG2 domain-containing protein [Paludisphaera borealis]
MALAEIPSTYGIPNPPDDANLNLGVAAIQRFLEAYPAHPRAVRSAYNIGVSHLARGKSDQALAALSRFLKSEGFRVETDEARKDLAELSMTATFQYGQILQGQQKFEDAVAAWKGYLAAYPNGPQSADAQRAILDTRLLIAADHLRRGRYPEARAAWSDFVAQNPLDERVPQALFLIGESFLPEKKFDQALAAWSTLAGKFPNAEPAAHAQFLTGSILEIEKGEPAAAIERFKKITVEPWKSQAGRRIVVMEAKSLTVVTPRAFRSGETPFLKISSRNLERLTFTAYKLNAEAYFRKKHGLEKVESLDIGLVAPDAEWTEDVPAFAKYKPVESNYELKKLEVPGVYVVKVTDQKTLQATSLVVASDVDAIVKTSREQFLVFAQDMKTGKGRPGAKVLVSDAGQVVLEAKTGADGVLLHDWSPPREGGRRLTYLIVDGAHVAGSGLGVLEQVSQGLTPRAYLYTDRPAHRPGQKVSIRGVVREVRDGQYATSAGSVYHFEVVDAKGRQLVSRKVTLSEFGTFHETLPLDVAAPVGAYRMRVYQPGKSDFAGVFEVQSYQLEPIDLAFDLKKTVYYRGETIEADVNARYQYGAPVARRPLNVTLPDGRVLSGVTDDAGKFHISIPTEGFAEQQPLRLAAQLTQDNVQAASWVMLAVRGFEINVELNREVYLTGETFAVHVRTSDAHGDPISEKLSAALVKLVNQHGQIVEREVVRKEVETDASGKGVVSLKADDLQGGNHLIRVAGTDRFRNPIVADRPLYISGKQDETKLRILAERQQYKAGEEASVNVHSRGRAGTALLTWEADRILSYRIVPLADGDNPVAWSVDGAQFPNFTLTAVRMWENQFDQAKLDVAVERDLRVTIAPVKPVVAPGDPVEIDVTTVDQLGRPVAAELSIAMIDQSLLRLFGDRQTPIGPFFYDQTRTGAFATEATNTFHYAPSTGAVAQAVVEEAEMAGAMAANAEDRKVLEDQTKNFFALQAQAPDASQLRRFATGAEIGVPNQLGAQANVPLMGTAPMGGMGGGRDAAKSKNRRYGKAPVLAKAPWRKGESEKLGEVVNGGFEGLTYSKDFDGLRDFEKFGEAGRGEPRERFVETAYWNPSVVTGKDGKARVTFNAPPAFSEYKITARGVTGGDSLVGQSTATLRVRKDFFVDIKAPASLTQGDKPRFVARVHHLGVEGTVALKLSVYGGGRDQVYPKTVEIKGDGVEEVFFEPIEAAEGGSMRLSLSATVGERSDQLAVEIPVHPWGVQAYASASGTSSDGSAVFVGLPKGRTYEDAEMQIVVSPSLERMIVELALGREYRILRNSLSAKLICSPADTMSDRAADLLAATSALTYLRQTRPDGSPDAQRLVDRIQGLVAELTAAQNDDGGWPWVSPPRFAPGGNQPPNAASERFTSASVFWALATAERLGLLADPKVCDKAAGWLNQAMTAGANARDREARAALLHALSTRKAASFESANSLNRERQNLSNTALAYLALTFANLGRAELAGEVFTILGPRAKTEQVAPGRRARLYWDDANQSAGAKGTVETTALVCLAYATARGQATELPQAIDWLEAHRFGAGWNPHRAKGAALAALAAFHGRSKAGDDRYKLTVVVNDTTVAEIPVAGAAEGQVIDVPVKALKPGDSNRVAFTLEGRGTFSFAVSMTGFTREFGPDQDRQNRPAWVDRRVYWPAPPELDGKTLPAGFGSAVNPTTFENIATQVALGGKARVGLTVWRNVPADTPDWDRDFLVVEERLPAGTTLIENSVQTSATSYTLVDGLLTFYFAPDQNPGGIQYDVYGYLPGQYRTLPALVRSAYEPGRFHVGQPGEFRVLAPGEKNTDPYRPSPDELLARGKALFDAGKHEPAAEALEPLFAGYTLRDDVAKDVSRMLLLIHIGRYDARKIVQYFEVVKEKSPELIITFDQLQTIGRAYRDINEYERAMIVWRGLIEASYLEDARVGELLRQRGQTLEAMTYLTDLWRQYPNTPSIESDFFGLSQVLADAASKAFTDPALRKELASAGITKSELLVQSIRLIQTFLSQSPTNPTADEASLALVGALLELEDYKNVVKAAGRYAKLYPKSSFLDSFQYSEALANFHLGQYDRAVKVAEAIAGATYKDAAGVDQPSTNKWQAVYILGQIFDARRMPAKALEYYRQVDDRFSDAASAVRFYTRKDLKVAEVSVVRPAAKPVVAGAPGLQAVGVARLAPGDAAAADQSPGIKLEYRNQAKVDLTVYPVDLMQLYLTRRNLNAIAGIDLAGITPLVEKEVVLGSGADYDDKTRTVDLPLAKEGAYLVMIRGDDLYASGIVLVSPLELEVLEEPPSGRVRVTVRDARTKEFLPKVQVKVIGSANPQFISGETDLRGVFVAEGVQGQATVVVRKDTTEYAFHRGTTYVGAPPQPANPEPSKAEGQASSKDANQSLDANLKIQNQSNSMRQLKRLEQRYQQVKPEALPGAPAGDFH